MPRTVTFYFSLLSPWVYFSGPRFQDILQRTGARVLYRPIDIFRIFGETGGTPLSQLHPSRKAYRARERERWSTHLGMPISAEPRFHPADESMAARMLIALQSDNPQADVWPLAHSILAGVWVQDRNIADPDTLGAIAAMHDLNGSVLQQRAREPWTETIYQTYTAEAIAAGVFGVPSFVVEGELFFGQDRLDFVERALCA